MVTTTTAVVVVETDLRADAPVFRPASAAAPAQTFNGKQQPTKKQQHPKENKTTRKNTSNDNEDRSQQHQQQKQHPRRQPRNAYHYQRTGGSTNRTYDNSNRNTNQQQQDSQRRNRRRKPHNNNSNSNNKDSPLLLNTNCRWKEQVPSDQQQQHRTPGIDNSQNNPSVIQQQQSHRRENNNNNQFDKIKKKKRDKKNNKSNTKRAVNGCESVAASENNDTITGDGYDHAFRMNAVQDIVIVDLDDQSSFPTLGETTTTTQFLGAAQQQQPSICWSQAVVAATTPALLTDTMTTATTTFKQHLEQSLSTSNSIGGLTFLSKQQPQVSSINNNNTIATTKTTNKISNNNNSIWALSLSTSYDAESITENNKNNSFTSNSENGNDKNNSNNDCDGDEKKVHQDSKSVWEASDNRSDTAVSSLPPPPPNENGSRTGTSSAAAAATATTSLSNTRRSTDFSKLRDRWWDLLQNHQQQQKQQKDYLALTTKKDADDDNSTSSSSSSDSSDLSFVDVCQQNRQNSKYVPTEIRELVNNNNNNDDSSLGGIYGQSPEPIHESIRRGDAGSLRTLLKNQQQQQRQQETNRLDTSDSVISPLQLAIQLDRPLIVKIILREQQQQKQHSRCKSSNVIVQGGIHVTNEELTQAIFTAAENGLEECLQILLMESSITSWTDPISSNNILHACCRGQAPVSVLQLVIDSITGCSGSSNHNVLLSKLFLAKNEAEQTPLHIVCQNGRDDLMDYILSTLSFSLLSKLLISQDNKKQTPFLAAVAGGSTDIVMSLLMWRGNNNTLNTNSNNQFIPLSATTNKVLPCPLKWAVLSRNLEMVLLLLEFNDPSGKGYNLTQALRVAVKLKDLEHDDDNVQYSYAPKEELARVLIEAGANPCCSNTPDTAILPTQSSQASSTAAPPKGLLTIAVEQRDVACLSTMLDTYQHYLVRIQSGRRRDPVLQKQPESFFAGMESREFAERTAAMRDALVTSLYLGFTTKPKANCMDSCQQYDFYDCVFVLLERGADLGVAGLERLKMSFRSKRLKPSSEVPVGSGLTRVFEACYCPIVSVGSPLFDNNLKYSAQEWSHVLLGLPWSASLLNGVTYCGWVSSELSRPRLTKFQPLDPDIVLTTVDGSSFLAHSAILSNCSDKMAAAIRFATMADSDTGDGILELKVNTSAEACLWMIQHMYHGSILSSLPENLADLSNSLCDLMLVAEEFICPTLVQECEMRLLSSDPWSQCFCWYCGAKGISDPSKSGLCKYRVVGPSACINARTALDVLAVSQSISDSFHGTDAYHLLTTSSDSDLGQWSSCFNSDSCTRLNPLEAVQTAAIESILIHFQTVTQTSAFSQLNDYPTESCSGEALLKDHKKSLLDMCLSAFSTVAQVAKTELIQQTTSTSLGKS